MIYFPIFQFNPQKNHHFNNFQILSYTIQHDFQHALIVTNQSTLILYHLPSASIINVVPFDERLQRSNSFEVFSVVNHWAIVVGHEFLYFLERRSLSIFYVLDVHQIFKTRFSSQIDENRNRFIKNLNFDENESYISILHQNFHVSIWETSKILQLSNSTPHPNSNNCSLVDTSKPFSPEVTPTLFIKFFITPYGEPISTCLVKKYDLLFVLYPHQILIHDSISGVRLSEIEASNFELKQIRFDSFGDSMYGLTTGCQVIKYKMDENFRLNTNFISNNIFDELEKEVIVKDTNKETETLANCRSALETTLSLHIDNANSRVLVMTSEGVLFALHEAENSFYVHDYLCLRERGDGVKWKKFDDKIYWNAKTHQIMIGCEQSIFSCELYDHCEPVSYQNFSTLPFSSPIDVWSERSLQFYFDERRQLSSIKILLFQARRSLPPSPYPLEYSLINIYPYQPYSANTRHFFFSGEKEIKNMDLSSRKLQYIKYMNHKILCLDDENTLEICELEETANNYCKLLYRYHDLPCVKNLCLSAVSFDGESDAVLVASPSDIYFFQQKKNVGVKLLRTESVENFDDILLEPVSSQNSILCLLSPRNQFLLATWETSQVSLRTITIGVSPDRIFWISDIRADRKEQKKFFIAATRSQLILCDQDGSNPWKERRVDFPVKDSAQFITLGENDNLQNKKLSRISFLVKHEATVKFYELVFDDSNVWIDKFHQISFLYKIVDLSFIPSLYCFFAKFDDRKERDVRVLFLHQILVNQKKKMERYSSPSKNKNISLISPESPFRQEYYSQVAAIVRMQTENYSIKKSKPLHQKISSADQDLLNIFTQTASDANVTASFVPNLMQNLIKSPRTSSPGLSRQIPKRITSANAANKSPRNTNARATPFVAEYMEQERRKLRERFHQRLFQDARLRHKLNEVSLERGEESVLESALAETVDARGMREVEKREEVRRKDMEKREREMLGEFNTVRKDVLEGISRGEEDGEPDTILTEKLYLRTKRKGGERRRKTISYLMEDASVKTVIKISPRKKRKEIFDEFLKERHQKLSSFQISDNKILTGPIFLPFSPLPGSQETCNALVETSFSFGNQSGSDIRKCQEEGQNEERGERSNEGAMRTVSVVSLNLDAPLAPLPQRQHATKIKRAKKKFRVDESESHNISLPWDAPLYKVPERCTSGERTAEGRKRPGRDEDRRKVEEKRGVERSAIGKERHPEKGMKEKKEGENDEVVMMMISIILLEFLTKRGKIKDFDVLNLAKINKNSGSDEILTKAIVDSFLDDLVHHIRGIETANKDEESEESSQILLQPLQFIKWRKKEEKKKMIQDFLCFHNHRKVLENLTNDILTKLSPSSVPPPHSPISSSSPTTPLVRLSSAPSSRTHPSGRSSKLELYYNTLMQEEEARKQKSIIDKERGEAGDREERKEVRLPPLSETLTETAEIARERDTVEEKTQDTQSEALGATVDLLEELEAEGRVHRRERREERKRKKEGDTAIARTERREAEDKAERERTKYIHEQLKLRRQESLKDRKIDEKKKLIIADKEGGGIKQGTITGESRDDLEMGASEENSLLETILLSRSRDWSAELSIIKSPRQEMETSNIDENSSKNQSFSSKNGTVPSKINTSGANLDANRSNFDANALNHATEFHQSTGEQKRKKKLEFYGSGAFTSTSQQKNLLLYNFEQEAHDESILNEMRALQELRKNLSEEEKQKEEGEERYWEEDFFDEINLTELENVSFFDANDPKMKKKLASRGRLRERGFRPTEDEGKKEGEETLEGREKEKGEVEETEGEIRGGRRAEQKKEPSSKIGQQPDTIQEAQISREKEERYAKENVVRRELARGEERRVEERERKEKRGKRVSDEEIKSIRGSDFVREKTTVLKQLEPVLTEKKSLGDSSTKKKTIPASAKEDTSTSPLSPLLATSPPPPPINEARQQVGKQKKQSKKKNVEKSLMSSVVPKDQTHAVPMSSKSPSSPLSSLPSSSSPSSPSSFSGRNAEHTSQNAPSLSNAQAAISDTDSVGRSNKKPLIESRINNSGEDNLIPLSPKGARDNRINRSGENNKTNEDPQPPVYKKAAREKRTNKTGEIFNEYESVKNKSEITDNPSKAIPGPINEKTDRNNRTNLTGDMVLNHAVIEKNNVERERKKFHIQAANNLLYNLVWRKQNQEQEKQEYLRRQIEEREKREREIYFMEANDALSFELSKIYRRRDKTSERHKAVKILVKSEEQQKLLQVNSVLSFLHQKNNRQNLLEEDAQFLTVGEIEEILMGNRDNSILMRKVGETVFYFHASSSQFQFAALAGFARNIFSPPSKILMGKNMHHLLDRETAFHLWRSLQENQFAGGLRQNLGLLNNPLAPGPAINSRTNASPVSSKGYEFGSHQNLQQPETLKRRIVDMETRRLELDKKLMQLRQNPSQVDEMIAMDEILINEVKPQVPESTVFDVRTIFSSANEGEQFLFAEMADEENWFAVYEDIKNFIIDKYEKLTENDGRMIRDQLLYLVQTIPPDMHQKYSLRTTWNLTVRKLMDLFVSLPLATFDALPSAEEKKLEGNFSDSLSLDSASQFSEGRIEDVALDIANDRYLWRNLADVFFDGSPETDSPEFADIKNSLIATVERARESKDSHQKIEADYKDLIFRQKSVQKTRRLIAKLDRLVESRPDKRTTALIHKKNTSFTPSDLHRSDSSFLRQVKNIDQVTRYLTQNSKPTRIRTISLPSIHNMPH